MLTRKRSVRIRICVLTFVLTAFSGMAAAAPVVFAHASSTVNTSVPPARIVADGTDYVGETCHGDMQSKAIPPDVYECYYDNGFAGAASSGWPPSMNFAWSRVAAALECGGVRVSLEKLMPVLVKKFKYGADIQKIVGIQFHRAQIHFDPKFCTAKRVAEYERVLPGFYQGHFPTG